MDPMTMQMMMQAGQGFGSGLQGFLSGMFGNSGAPYKDAMKEYEKYFNEAKGYQNPFYEGGIRGMGNYENWLGSMKDPSGFINNLMGKYKESPWAKYQQEQATRGAMNQGSASGLTGSTPLMQFAAQNARDISSQDMNQWLQNVLGINTQYGQGQETLMHGGQNAANSLSNLAAKLAELMGEGAYGQRAGENQDRNDMIAGLMKMFFPSGGNQNQSGFRY